MADSRYFYADSSNKPAGPHSLDELHALARKGDIKPSTKVIRKGDSQWMSYSQLPTKTTPTTPEPTPVMAASEDVPSADTGFSIWNLLRRLPKPIYFALIGAFGTFIGALAGQLLLLAVSVIFPAQQSYANVEKNICLVLDTSGSMFGEPLNEVKAAATAFVNLQGKTGNRMCVVSFDSDGRLVQPLTTDINELQSAINELSVGGSTALDLGLKQALRALPDEPEVDGTIADSKNKRHSNFVLIFTDGMPNDDEAAEKAAERLRQNGSTLIAIHTPDAPSDFLISLTGDPKLVFTTSTGNYGKAFDEAKRVIEKRQGIVAGTQKGNWLGSFLNAGGWFALVAVFLALALGVAQNKAMGRTGLSGYLTLKQLLFGCLIGIVAGLIAGLINLGFVMVSDVAIVSFIGGVLAWCILGGIIGTSMVLIIENFGFLRAIASGIVGGLLGGLAFNLIRLITGFLEEKSSLISSVGEGIGRLLGAVLVGALIGLFIAWIEQLTRKAWMEVQWTANQNSTVNLGSNPVTVGGSRENDVRIPGLNKVLSIILDGGRINCTQKPENKTFELKNNQVVNLGKVKLIIHSKVIKEE